MSSKIKSGFLYADPSFLSGASRTLDLFGVYDAYNASQTPQEADARALAADWIVTGQDIQEAVETLIPQQEEAA